MYSKKLMMMRKKTKFPRRIAIPFVISLILLSLFWLGVNSGQSARTAVLTNHEVPRIAIVTFTTSEKSYTYLSLKNKNFYAKQHGYSLFVDYETHQPRNPMWHKFVMVEMVMATQEFEWIWWIDFDTLITNTSIELSDIISESLASQTNPDEIDFLLTADCFQLNAGSMLVRSRPSSLAFLNRVRAYGDNNTELNEQDCIRDVVNANKTGEKEQVLWIPQWKINAFPEEIKCWDVANRGWERGVFVIHFAGAWAHVKEDDPTGYLMRKYESYIE